MKDPFAVERALAQQETVDSDIAELLGAVVFQPIVKKLDRKDTPPPKKGIDYFTKKEIEQIKEDILASIPTPEIEKVVIDYEYVQSYIDKKIKELPKPKPGVNGKDAVVNTEKLKKEVLELMPKIVPEKVDYKKIEELVDKKIKTIPKTEQRVVGYSSLRQLTDVILDGVPQDAKGNYLLGQGGSTNTFETVSKNLDATDATLNYTGENLTSIAYVNGITKTLNYTGENLTSVVLSGATPSGIDLTKTLVYTGDNLTGVLYS